MLRAPILLFLGRLAGKTIVRGFRSEAWGSDGG